MADYEEFIKVIQRIASNVYEAGQPTDYVYGTVTSTDPLKVKIDQKLVLGKAQLAFTRTAKESDLRKDDEIVLLKKKGGQQYLVIDWKG